MALRATTALSLVLATGLLAACNDDDDVSTVEADPLPAVEDTVADTSVVEAESGTVMGSEEVLEQQAEAVLNNQAGNPAPNVVVADPVLDETVNDAVVDQNAIAPDTVIAAETDGLLDGVGADTVGSASLLDREDGITTEDAVPEVSGGIEAALNANEGMDGEAVTAPTEITSAGDALQETPGEAAAALPNELVETMRDEAQARAMSDGEVFENDYATAEGEATAPVAVEDDAIVLSNNVTVVGDELEGTAQASGEARMAVSSVGELDAEARAVPGSGEEIAVEETNDVGTDGIDSGSELAMLDLDDMVLDQEGVQRLTSFIEESDAFTATQKITIVAGIDAARDDPQRFSQLMDQIRDIVASAN